MDNVICICGSVHLSCNTVRHLQSKTHINFIKDPLKVHIIKERSIRPVTCVCGSKYNFKNETWKLAHERSYNHLKYLNYKLDI